MGKFAILLLIVFAFYGIGQATTIVPTPLNHIRALSQSADAVVVTRVESFRRGRNSRRLRNGSYTAGTPATFVCDVQKTLAGPVSLNGKRHFSYERGGDFYTWKVTRDPVLLFVRRTNDGYELCDSPLQLENNFVQRWYEGKTFSGDFYSLHELLPLIKKHQAIKVRFFGWIPLQVSASDGTLPTAWIFKNIGRSPVLILPPSFCFNSLQSRRLRNGRWYSVRDPWQSVLHWDFYTKQEVPVSLAPGEQRTFYHKIPLSTLKMTEPGQYRMTFYYHQSQLSQHATRAKISAVQMSQTWLGEPPTITQRVQVL